MARVLITGAAGFVGANLVRTLLKKNDEIAVFVRDASSAWRIGDILNKLHVYPIDITNKEEISRAVHIIKPEVVYHLATYGGYPFHKNNIEIIRTNVLGGLFLFEALHACDSVRYIVNIGSSSEYGSKQTPMCETDILEPSTPYGIAKAAQTLLAIHFAREKNMPITTLRPLSVYGPFEESGRLINDIMVAFVTQKPLMLSSPFPRRDFVFIDDMIDAILKAAATPAARGNVYNIGGGRDYSIQDVVTLAKKIIGIYVPVTWGSREETRNFNSLASWVADISKAARELNWQPTHSLAQGLEKTYRWYRDNITFYEKS